MTQQCMIWIPEKLTLLQESRLFLYLSESFVQSSAGIQPFLVVQNRWISLDSSFILLTFLAWCQWFGNN